MWVDNGWAPVVIDESVFEEIEEKQIIECLPVTGLAGEGWELNVELSAVFTMDVIS